MKPKQFKNCIVCKKQFEKPPSCSQIVWDTKRKNCSKECQNKYWTGKPNGRKKQGSKNSMAAWNKGIPLTKEAKQKLSDKMKIVAIEKGYGQWMIGKKLSIETRQKQSESNLERIATGKHNFYIDGRTPERMVIRHSLDYKLWREAVFKRDDFTCKECKQRGVYIEAHHIKPFSLFPELRFAIDNGVTLCTACHAKVDIFRARTLSKKTK